VHYVCDLLLQRAFALAVVRRVPRDEFLDHGAQRGRLKRGVGDFGCRRVFVFVRVTLLDHLAVSDLDVRVLTVLTAPARITGVKRG
jgi:hypothetical protein